MHAMSSLSHALSARTLAWCGLTLGLAGIAGQYVFFQPLFRQMGMGPLSSALGMLMFFTVLTNLALVAAYWSWLSQASNRIIGLFRRTGVRTALAAHIALVAIVYITALRGHVEMNLPMLMTDIVLHYLAPAWYLVWWWRLPGKSALSYSDIPAWMAWPVLYLGIVMLAGLTTGAFVYPILDVNLLGAKVVALNIVLILGLLAALCTALVLVARLRDGKTKAPAR